MRLILKQNIRLRFLWVLVIAFWAASVQAWNDDYHWDDDLLDHSICSKAGGAGLQVRLVVPDEPCAIGEQRFRMFFGKEPKGSVALVPEDFHTPLDVATRIQGSSRALWYYHCYATQPMTLLGRTVERRTFRGEITLPLGTKSCQDGESAALKTCREGLGGNEVAERCY